MTLNLFDSPSGAESRQERLKPGAVVLRGLATSDEAALLAALQYVTARRRRFATWSRRAASACRWQ
jgi:hypothetical protein